MSKHKNPKHGPNHDEDHADIPELDDIVDESDAPGARPPPNLDLFGDASLDPTELREELLSRLTDEVDQVIGDIRGELALMLDEKLEARLRDRIEIIIDEILAERSNRPR